MGKTQIVDQAVSSLNSPPCSDENSGCDLHGAIALANKISPIPLIVKIKSPKIDLSGANLDLTGDALITGILSVQTLIDAKSLSRHFDVRENAHLELVHLRLINGKSDTGGSVRALKSTLLVKDSSFQNNIADNEIDFGLGGAIFSSYATLEVLNSEFESNKTRLNGTTSGGGAIYVTASVHTSIRDSHFKSNTGQQGGAIDFYSMNNQIFEISNCIFESNFAIQGGAIHTLWADGSIAKSSFIHNEAIFDGGAIHFSSTTRGWVSDSLFDGNKGGGVGSAAIYWEAFQWQAYRGKLTVLYILDSKFMNHRSDHPAAVILNYGSQVVLRGVELTNNGPLKNCQSLSHSAGSEFLSLGGNYSSDGTCPP